MEILLLTPALPYPPHQGGTLRNFGLIHGLHATGHNITLLSFADSNSAAGSTPLRDICKKIVTIPLPHRGMQQRLRDLLISRQPDLARRLKSNLFREHLMTLLESTAFDLVQFEGLEMTGYLPLVRQLQPNAKVCYDAHNAEYQLQQLIFEVDRSTIERWPAAIYSWIQARRITRFERAVCQQADCVLAVSDEDAAALKHFRTNIAVIPNGIFTEQYANNPEELDLGPHVLTFTGKMDYRPNVDAMLWFTDEVLPLIKQQVPDARLYIVGQKPHARLEVLRDIEQVFLTGWVPEIHPFLSATTVYVAPLRMGSGTRLKILEAMAAGCAVAATSLAAAGLPEDARKTLLIADTAPELAQAINNLLQNADQRQQLGEAAQAVVHKHYDWSVLIPRLLDAYKDIGLG